MEKSIEKKLKWTQRFAILSFGILIIALGINYFREPLFGIKKGYAPQNFSFNFIFFLPTMLLSLGLGLAAFGRTLKHWRTWNNLNKKLIFIGLSIPVMLLWTIQIIRIFIN